MYKISFFHFIQQLSFTYITVFSGAVRQPPMRAENAVVCRRWEVVWSDNIYDLVPFLEREAGNQFAIFVLLPTGIPFYTGNEHSSQTRLKCRSFYVLKRIFSVFFTIKEIKLQQNLCHVFWVKCLNPNTAYWDRTHIVLFELAKTTKSNFKYNVSASSTKVN